MGRYPWLTTFVTDARLTVAPPRGGKDGLLPPLVIALAILAAVALTGVARSRDSTTHQAAA
jgi:hypothetical protein